MSVGNYESADQEEFRFDTKGPGWAKSTRATDQLPDLSRAPMLPRRTRGVAKRSAPAPLRSANPTVSVIIPTLNEAQNLPHVLPLIPRWVHEVVLVDGGSTDGTVEVCRELWPTARIVIDRSAGKGRALFTGMHAATGDILVTIDADGSMDPGELPRYVYSLMAGADFVKGSRFLHGGLTDDMELLRRVGNRALTEIVRRLYGGRFSDLCYGYNAFWRDVVPYLAGEAPGFEIETHMNVRALAAGLQVVEVPTWEASRVHGVSHLNTFRDGFRVLRTIVMERRAIARSHLDPPAVARSAVGLERGARERRRMEENGIAGAPNGTLERRGSDLAKPQESSRRRAPERHLDPTVHTCSVVICTHDEKRWDDLVRAVESAKQQTRTPLEVLVVVDHNPFLLRRARADLEGVTVLENHDNKGLSGARNTAARAAGGSIVAFLDDDAHAEGDWIERLLAPYAHPQVQGVGGSVLAEWDAGRPAWFPEEFDWVVGCSYKGLPTIQSPVRNLIGCNMSFRREMLLSLGGFDESLGRNGNDGAGCEETEFCIRVRQEQAGAVILYEPAARVRHHVPASRGTKEYFAQRCKAEGRSKALVASMAGPADALSSERTYLVRVIPTGLARAIGRIARLDLAGFGEASAIAGGVAKVGGQYMRNRRRTKVRPVPAVTQPQVEVPRAGTLDIDVSGDLPAIHPGQRSAAEPTVLCLVRRDQRPIGIVELHVPDDGLAPEQFAVALWESLDLDLEEQHQDHAPGSGPQANGHSRVPEATVVVATRDRPEQLVACVNSILAMQPAPSRVVVVDNAPADDRTKRAFLRHFGHDERIRYVREDRPGLGSAHNRGLAEVETELVAFTDDDVIVDPAWLYRLASCFVGDNRVAAATGLIFPAELQTREQWWIERTIGFGRGIDRKVFDADVNRPDDVLFPYTAGQFGSGANMAFRTSFLRGMGGFANALGTGTPSQGGDDLAAFQAVMVAGGRLVYEPAAIVFHHHRRDYPGLRRQMFGYGVGLTAYLTHVVVERPGASFGMGRRWLKGIRRARHGSRGPGRVRPVDYPARLVWLERAGMVVGPWRYLRSRRQVRAGSE